MTIEQLGFFISCTRLKSIRKAASYHFVSQSTLSRKIDALENELATRLLERHANGVTLTEAGEVFFQDATLILHTMEQAIIKLVERGYSQMNVAKKLRLASPPGDGIYLRLFSILAQLPLDTMNKQFRLDTDDNTVQAVLTGKACVGLGASCAVKKHTDTLSMRFFGRVPLQLYVNYTHPLSRYDSLSTQRLLELQLEQSRFMPWHSANGDGVSELQSLREIADETQQKIPWLLDNHWITGRPDAMLLLPDTLEHKQLNAYKKIALADKLLYAEYAIFWRTEDPDPDLSLFLELYDAYYQGAAAAK